MTVKSYEDLDVWRQSMELVEQIYRLTDNFPKEEQYRLVDQLCRAAVSIPSNIAEGSKRHTTREYLRFVGIAQGSLAEVETQLVITKRLAYIDEQAFHPVMELAKEVGRCLGGLHNALARKIRGTESSLALTPALTP